jgi:phosphoserine phosphatase
VSGSIKEIIRHALGDSNLALLDGIYANSFDYDENDVLRDIESTKFDFEGKADFIRRLAEEKGISPAEVLFVGNSLNDEFAAAS